ncbi:MAG: YcxB family protein [Planctomycetota bacterium]
MNERKERAEVTFRQQASEYVEHALAEFDDPKTQAALLARKRFLIATVSVLAIGGASLGLLGAALAGLVGFGSGDPLLYLIGLAIGLLLSTPLVWPHLRELRAQKRARLDAARQILSIPSLTLESEVTVIIDPESVSLRDRFAVAGWLWPAVESVKPVRRGIAIGTRNNRIILIPNRAFEAPEEGARFLELAERFHQAANNGQAMIAAFLEDHDLPCPECDQQLNGCANSKCPNCGAEITLEDVREYLTWKLTGAHAEAA